MIDPIPASNPNAKMFSIEPLKVRPALMGSQSSTVVKLNDFNNGSSLYSCVQSSVEAGSLKTVTITFHPPRDSSIHTLEASTNVSTNQSSFCLFYGTCLVSTIVLATILIANRVEKMYSIEVYG